jgi:hypothetical protein
MPFGPFPSTAAPPILNAMGQRRGRRGDRQAEDGRTQATVCPPADTQLRKKTLNNNALKLAQDLLCIWGATNTAKSNNE